MQKCVNRMSDKNKRLARSCVGYPGEQLSTLIPGYAGVQGSHPDLFVAWRSRFHCEKDFDYRQNLLRALKAHLLAHIYRAPPKRTLGRHYTPDL